jgi:hypothetical protein
MRSVVIVVPAVLVAWTATKPAPNFAQQPEPQVAAIGTVNWSTPAATAWQISTSASLFHPLCVPDRSTSKQSSAAALLPAAQ